MDSRCGHGKVVRMRVEDDRISSLPDDLIHKILSFVGLKLAVQTSAVSSRWRYIWTSLPYLNFLSKDFRTLLKFSKFVKHFISGCNNQLEVSSVKLTFHEKAFQLVVKRIMDYALSHNVQQLSVTSCGDRTMYLPDSLYSLQSLKCLSMIGISCESTWCLSSLITLYLDDVTFYDEEGICNISKCANLKNLTLRKCKMERSLGVTVGVNIHLPELSNLTLEYGEYSYGSSLTKGLNVFAPKLVSLVFKGPYSVLLQFSSFSLCVLEKVDLCIYKRFYKADKTKYDKFVALLHQLHNAKYIKLNLDVTQLIFNLGEIILHQPSPFAKLKHLKVYPHDPFSTEQQTMPTKVKNYFLDSSPDATFTMVSYEEMKSVEYATSAQKDMAELQMLLEEGKIHHERETKIHEKQLDTKEIQITNCLKDMSVQIEQGKVKICGIISKLGQIENWLKKLPKTDRIHSCFSSLRAEAYTVIKLIMDCTKIKCDEKQGCINVCLHELATASQPSS